MPRTTSFQLTEELDRFIDEKVQSGAYKSASEVMRTALERFAKEDRETEEICRVLDRALKDSPRAQIGAFKRLRARHGIGK
jgi:putative addiction module CopG family antidote